MYETEGVVRITSLKTYVTTLKDLTLTCRSFNIKVELEFQTFDQTSVPTSPQVSSRSLTSRHGPDHLIETWKLLRNQKEMIVRVKVVESLSKT